MTSAEVAKSLNCTPQYVRSATKKATDNNKNTITIKGETYSFVEVVTVASRGKAYCYTSVEEMVKKRKTSSKNMSFLHLEELKNLNITAKKHSKEEKLLLITFINKYNYTLKIIIESLLANIGEPREPKLVASLTRKVQRWRKEFATNGAKALEDKRGKTRQKFSKIDEELLIKAIYGAGSRGIRENYYGVWDFYCYAWQKKNEPTFTTVNKKVISYSALRRAIHSIFKVNKTVESYWKKGEDALLQSYPVGIKEINYTNQEWQVDATKFDFMCRYVGADGGVKIGRLNLTAVIDVHTGNAVATLSETITSYDQVRVIHKAFERMGMPEQIYTDNGKDYVSYHYSEVLFDLGITQITAQVGQGRQKGKIERFFGVIQSDLAKIAGYIGNNVAKRTRIEECSGGNPSHTDTLTHRRTPHPWLKCTQSHFFWVMQSHLLIARPQQAFRFLWTQSTMLTSLINSRRSCSNLFIYAVHLHNPSTTKQKQKKKKKKKKKMMMMMKKKDGLCGCQATFELEFATELRSCVKVEVAVLGFFFPNSPYGLCGS